ncbi:hypothetical protein IW140_000526 [Coemansia sp. RSA 1813]|nr:hypothetical protein EV178_004037 [Coemansia sp. RSA 1646]KAJ1773992.1 hypothetical protein LPJ74_000091 [Coemansia sp. RSA 1843]KAJ2092616.1 hypothetical protein IW138_001054 [Coemansia sp. RSA 986]KAJ2213374.1 hypothetical protein EV179_003883 [Coemansia sp. RSA 487]KAJ2572763.1 hypothetical protein IW140_000526 [Coemansia sp. RSA 1813]
MLSTSSLTLHPDKSEVILYGGPSEASGTFITGCVVVPLKYVSQLKNLSVTLRPQRQRLFHSTNPVTPPTHLQVTLVVDGKTAPHADNSSAGSNGHEWRFSIGIPGTIAETAYSKTHFVAYELVAEARVSGTFASSVHSKAHPVSIKRTPSADSSWTIAANEPFCENAVWRSRLELSILCDTHLFHDQQELSVSGVLRPLEKGFSLLRAGFRLTERIAHIPTTVGWTAVEATKNIVADNTIDLPSTSPVPYAGEDASDLYGTGPNGGQKGLPLYHEITASRSLRVPEAYKGIQYDIHRGPIRISHELVFFVTIIDRIGNIHNLQLCAPVFVLPKIDGKRTLLPRYEDTDTDPLLETSDGRAPRRDRNILSQYVLVDIEVGDTESIAPAMAPAETEVPDSCPLEHDGFKPADNDAPPPSYPGAISSIERTVISSEECVAASQDAPVRINRMRKICSRALLRAPPSHQSSTSTLSSAPPLPPPPANLGGVVERPNAILA